jgi:hypothetical protein
MRRFAYRLAVKLGYVNVDKMLSEISFRQLLEWETFSQLEPFDEERADVRSAHIVSMIANTNRNPKKRSKPWPLEDFIIPFGDSEKREKPRKSWQHMKMIAQMMTNLFGEKKSDA